MDSLQRKGINFDLNTEAKAMAVIYQMTKELPRQYDMNEYRMMEEFIYDLPAGRAQDALDAAIRGKGAFCRFKDRLYDFDLQEKWYKYRDDCYEQIARDWCERFGIEIEE